MKKIKSNISNAFAKAQTMSESEKKLNSLIFKLTLKKTAPHLIGILAVILLGFNLNINTFAIIAIEIILGIMLYKKTKKISSEFNDFVPYQGNVISVQTNEKSCNVILKQGKMPVKIEIHHLIEEFKNLKKNDFVRISYNKDKKIAMLYKK